MIFRNRYFWMVLLLASLVAGFFSFRYFSQAFPLVSLDLRMERSDALDQARKMAEDRHWGPEGFRQAASFGLDSGVQNFVELEGGGKEAFHQMVRSGSFAPFTWTVRHYQEHEKTTTTIQFTPEGIPYGFWESLPEDEPGASLIADAAREIAEVQAQSWGFRAEDYSLVEQSQERRLSGRTDHTFVFERPRRDIGEGRYRLRLTVSGDRFTGFSHFVKIPEGFSRRYEEMRSANNTIGVVGSVAMALLYVLGGCVVGIFILVKRGWFLWKRAVIWGCFVALFQALSSLNQFPLFWMFYDTAVSVQDFVIRQMALVLVEFLGLAVLMSLSFMAAESLSRKAFPHHSQLWKVWAPGNANSRQILGQTAGAYLLVPLFFGYEVVLYVFSQRLLGWWTPSDALIVPDILATYFPWFTAIANSLQAGFWEECLFRAVPLASAALLGERFGRRRLWIAAAMLLQALIFGAGHAPYATQPAYARVVELIVPSFLFGGLYLAFGLLPGIILHFAFDVVWFALPLFVASGPGAVYSQVPVILLTFVPLWMVLLRRTQAGAWNELPDSERNGNWRVEEKPAEHPEGDSTLAGPATRFSPAVGKGIVAFGILSLLVWWWSGPSQDESRGLNVTQSEAVEMARQVLKDKGIDLSTDWQVLASVVADRSTEHGFIWRTAGQDVYRRLLGSYLDPPLWRVRFARFEGDVEERAEEFRIFIQRGGGVYRFQHRIPEGRPAESLEAEGARDLALRAVAQQFSLVSSQFEEVSVEPTSHLNRVDWGFTYRDRTVELSEGEARITVRVSGTEIADVFRFVHIPEDWMREERSRDIMVSVVRVLSGAFLGLLWLAGVVYMIATWTRRGLALVAFAVSGGLVFAANLLSLANRWPALQAQFDTAQPLSNQILVLLIGGFMSSLVLAGFTGLVFGLTGAGKRRPGKLGKRWSPALGAALAALGVGLGEVASQFSEARVPEWASYESADSMIPALGPALNVGASYLLVTAALLLILVLTDGLTHFWTRRKTLFTSLLFLTGGALAGFWAESLTDCLVLGIPAGLLFVFLYTGVLRFDYSVVVWMVGSLVVFHRIRELALKAYPGSVPGEVVAIVVVLILSWMSWKWLSASGEATPAQVVGAESTGGEGNTNGEAP